MFTFGFSRDENDKVVENIKSSKECEEVEIKTSRELKAQEFEKIDEYLKSYSLTYKTYKEKMRFIDNIDVVLELLTSEDDLSQIIKAEEKHSDLLPGIYEGGCKIWECTHDLINFIENEQKNLFERKVLDLGCGAGLIGIMCMIKGAKCYFQDYNDEVLRYVTYPNIKANLENIPQFDFNRCKFFCGDWLSFSELWQKEYSPEDKFDYIFTSETIYSPNNYMKLHNIFQNLLSPSGVILLAAKAHYFGPGGGLFDFKNILDKEGIFSYQTVWSHTNGLVREILEIKFK
ncbi:histidine protein methyltransferase 1 homolog [Coccinella septempunctata]|uniref:histidine protein methyltransferase 1 homolog n=1 Tax=Coccinella septempunctata TaxID=41139 RepID=UPI001D08908E|nr:histidine protein methyltransferase 1 homolog [Coccinella septempunctata]